MKKKRSWEVTVLKSLLFIYILLALVIAGINYGLAPKASEKTQSIILNIWQFYENQFKTALIIAGTFLTLRIVKKKEIPRLRRKNLIGLISAALVVHIAGSLLSRNPDLYFFAMPLPWSTTALQLAVNSSSFHQHHAALWGLRGVTIALVFFLTINIVVFTGTLLMGRRWQCSTICLFNGFASEVFSPAFPLFGKKKRFGEKMMRFLSLLRWILLCLSLLFTVFWLLVIALKIQPAAMIMFEKVEVYKYLILELLMAMLFWTAFVGRGYCYYCPLGTILGWLGRAVGQKIVTTKTECIGCGKCDSVCPMSISISEKAGRGEDVIDTRCVGCGHCVDACPVNTLGYSTVFLKKLGRV